MESYDQHSLRQPVHLPSDHARTSSMCISLAESPQSLHIPFQPSICDCCDQDDNRFKSRDYLTLSDQTKTNFVGNQPVNLHSSRTRSSTCSDGSTESGVQPHSFNSCIFSPFQHDNDDDDDNDEEWKLINHDPGNKQRWRRVILLFCLLQFLIWFKPNDQYFITVVPGWYNISYQTILRDIYAHSMYAPFVLFPIIAILFDRLGFFFVTWLCASASALTIALVVFGKPHIFALILSQWTWVIHFSALFVVPAAMYAIVPKRWYMTVASSNSSAMLLASLLSALVGFTMARAAPTCNTSLNAMGNTFYVSLAFASAGVVFWLITAIPRTWLPKAQLRIPLPWVLFKRLLIRKQLWFWVLPSVVVRGIHTLVLEVWPALSAVHFPNACQQSYNGLIGFSMQLFAVGAVASLIYISPKSYGKYLPVILSLIGTGCLALIGFSMQTYFSMDSDNSDTTGMVIFGALLTLYNCACETLFTYCGANAAKIIRVEATVPNNYAIDDTMLTQMKKDTNTHGICHIQQSCISKFCAVLTIRAGLTQIWQVIAQFTIWPNGVWPLHDNVYSMHLTIMEQFYAFAIFTAVAAIITGILLVCRWHLA